ncbi:nascent polypeptide-associated complex protein [archaeon SCG-AAA382B04]|nr:nascent polypeptide-associated complex protein [archaeon SCG-AAA382B04]
MLPGGRGNLNPRKMKQMMKQMGIDIEEVEDVEEVVIKTKKRDLVFQDADVTKMNAQGQQTYQVVGEPEQEEKEVEPDEEDVELVVQQANASKEEAKKALKETDGDIADAIFKLKD